MKERIYFYPEGKVYLDNDHSRPNPRSILKPVYMWEYNKLSHRLLWHIWDRAPEFWRIISDKEVPNEIRVRFLLIKD